MKVVNQVDFKQSPSQKSRTKLEPVHEIVDEEANYFSISPKNTQGMSQQKIVVEMEASAFEHEMKNDDAGLDENEQMSNLASSDNDGAIEEETKMG